MLSNCCKSSTTLVIGFGGESTYFCKSCDKPCFDKTPPSPKTKPVEGNTPREKAVKLLKYLGGDWDVTICSECATPIVIEINTGEPQICNRLNCVYEALKGEL